MLRPLRQLGCRPDRLYTSDERVARMTSSIPHPLPPGSTEAFVAQARMPGRSEDVWAIDGTQTGHGEVLGLISLKRLDRGQSEIGFWVAPAFWNTGIATEAVAALVEANPHASTDALRACVPGQPGLGAGADQLRLRLSGRRRVLFGRAPRDGADLDLLPPDGLTRRGAALPRA